MLGEREKSKRNTRLTAELNLEILQFQAKMIDVIVLS